MSYVTSQTKNTSLPQRTPMFKKNIKKANKKTKKGKRKRRDDSLYAIPKKQKYAKI